MNNQYEVNLEYKGIQKAAGAKLTKSVDGIDRIDFDASDEAVLPALIKGLKERRSLLKRHWGLDEFRQEIITLSVIEILQIRYDKHYHEEREYAHSPVLTYQGGVMHWEGTEIPPTNPLYAVILGQPGTEAITTVLTGKDPSLDELLKKQKE
ncbi:MAG: hypothetical protein V2A62_00855 [Candidatus Woesearchaeota archaeon]